jgi:thioredoxin-related protein
MKQILFLFILASSLFAEIKWVYDFEEAKDIAKKEGKIVKAFISMEACPICTFMKEKVFTIKEVEDYMHKNFVNYYIDLDMDEVPEDFEVYGTPTTYFVKPDGEIIDTIIGGVKPGYYIPKMEAILEHK